MESLKNGDSKAIIQAMTEKATQSEPRRARAAAGFYGTNVIQLCQARGGYNSVELRKLAMTRAKHRERRQVTPA
jgi:hypothetical protein